jgi:hypothetical protein
MIFKQIDINLNRFNYIVEKDGVTVIKKKLFSVSKRFFPFENVGEKIIKERERKLPWLIISFFFFALALLVFMRRLKGGNVSDTAEMFWIIVSTIFFIIYAYNRKHSVFLVKDDMENGIEFIGTKIYEKRLSRFIKELLQEKEGYLSEKYPAIDGLTSVESMYCANAKISPQDGSFLKKLTQCPLEQLSFTAESSETKMAEGIQSLTTEQNARKILEDHREKYISKNKYIFISSFSGDEYHIAIIGTTADPYKIIEYAGTNGANHDITTKKIIAKCKAWDKEFGIKLTSIGDDFCECEIKNKDIDYKKLAIEVYDFCPDVVDHGTGTIELLEKVMKKQGRIFLWWD